MRRFLRTGRHDSPPSSSLTSPPQAGLQLWFKADALALADGAAVNPWPDSHAGLNAALLGAVAPVWKVNILNGLPVVRFTNAQNNVLALSVADSAPLLLASFTLCTVSVQRVQPASRGGIISLNDLVAAAGWQSNIVRPRNTSIAVNAAGVSVVGTLASAALGVGVRSITTHDAAPVTRWFFNSALVKTDAVQPVAYSANTQLALGTNGVVAGVIQQVSFAGFDLAEALYYDHALSDADRSAVDGYLADKWGV